MLRELVIQPHCCNFGNKICLKDMFKIKGHTDSKKVHRHIK